MDINIFSSSDVLHFWFVETPAKNWFMKDPDFDRALQKRFGNITSAAQAGDYDEVVHSDKEKLALIIVLDQFSRNIYRDTPRAFMGDGRALALTENLLEKNADDNFSDNEKIFMYLPLEHSENLAHQELSVAVFSKIQNDLAKDMAKKHLDIIKRFGRFPHRNKILSRTNTAEEIEFLKQPDSSF